MTFCVCRLCKSHGVNGVGCKFIQLEIKGVRKMLKVWICDKCDKELLIIYDQFADDLVRWRGLKNEN